MRCSPALLALLLPWIGLPGCGPRAPGKDETGAPDLEPPTVRLEAPAQGDVLTGPFALVATADDDRGVARVEFLADGQLLAVTEAEPWTAEADAATLVNGPYTVTARASDAASNHASDSADVWVHHEDGLDPAGVRIVYPAEGAVLCGTVEVRALVEAESPSVAFLLDGLERSVDDAEPFAWDWDTRAASNGEHRVEILATDAEGRQGRDRVDVRVENSDAPCDNPPSVIFLEPAGDTFGHGDIAVRLAASDDVGVTGVQLFVDGGLYLADDAVPYEMSWASDAFAEGPRVLSALATDTTGQTGEARVTVTVDRTPPTVALRSPEAGATLSGEALLAAEADDAWGLESVSFSVDGALVTTLGAPPWEADLDTRALPYGAHEVTARALDHAGHAATDARSFEVDNPPSLVFLEPTHGDRVSGHFQVRCEATDDDAIRSLRLYLDDVLAARWTEAPWEGAVGTCDAAGPRTLLARALDSGGQEAEASLEIVVERPLVVEIAAPTGSPDADATLLALTDDDVSVTHVTFDLDGAELARVDVATPSGVACPFDCGCEAWSAPWDTRAVRTGPHVLRATAWNVVGESASVTARLDVDHDADDDGFDAADFGGPDCDDDDAAVHPGAAEACDGVDDDCDGLVDEDYDLDADGFFEADACEDGLDCDDLDPDVHPGAVEVCDGVDNDCDGDVDLSDEVGTLSVRQGVQTGITTVSDTFRATAFEATADGHLQGMAVWMRQYTDASVTLRVYEATTRWDWHLVASAPTSDCCTMEWYESGPLDVTLVAGRYYAFGFGVTGSAWASVDNDPELVEEGGLRALGSVYDMDDPAPESFSEDPYAYGSWVHRLDVDTIADVDLDDDGDGYTGFCGDCDDADAALNPARAEICEDGLDNDCDGLVDEVLDLDGDGVDSCTDCDDANPRVHPGASETCDHLDEDCDGLVDEHPIDGAPRFADDDGDGYGDPSRVSDACAWSAGFSDDPTDCDDADATAHPGAEELCDGVDNDCDGVSDEDFDADGDGFGECLDCDDEDPSVFPGAEDACDGVDDDCDGHVDNSGLWDEETPSFGDMSCYNYDYTSFMGNVYTVDRASVLEGFQALVNVVSSSRTFYARVYVADAASGPYTLLATETLVADAAGGAWMGPTELGLTLSPGRYYLVGLGNSGYQYAYLDCSTYARTLGSVSERGAIEDYAASAPTTVSGTPDAEDAYVQRLVVRVMDDVDFDADSDGQTPWCGDCDDADASVHEGAEEACDGVDDDCDGLVDEGYDSDGDGYADTSLCGAWGDDCDDADPAIHPGVLDLCDGVDDDCDGYIDISDASGEATGTFGSTSTTTTSTIYFFGNVYRPTQDATLLSLRAYFNTTSATTATWAVYEATTETGVYTRVLDVSTSVPAGAAWRASGVLDWPLRPDRYYLVGVGAVGTRRPYWEGSPALIEAAGLRPVGYLHSTTTWAPTSLTSDPSTARLYAQELDIMLWDDADLDADGDGYSPWCGDCDDLDPDVHPGAPETCDGVDDDCDGLVDEGC